MCDISSPKVSHTSQGWDVQSVLVQGGDLLGKEPEWQVVVPPPTLGQYTLRGETLK